MYVKRMAAAAAIATGVGMAALTFGAGLVNAAPLDPPPPCPDCRLVPADREAGRGTILRRPRTQRYVSRAPGQETPEAAAGSQYAVTDGAHPHGRGSW
jgi:hypothetical protein